MKINENIFRPYDIRGKVPSEIDETVAYLIGRSYGSYVVTKLGFSDCLVGYDNRVSSIPFRDAMVKGIRESGCDVIDLGLITTPVLYLARYNLKKVGIMITASHNPGDENGFKFSFDFECNARGEMIEDFKNYTLACKFNEGEGSYSTLDYKQEYFDYLLNNVSFGDRKLKVVIDCGNGTASIYAKELHDKLPFDFEYIFCNSDPTFPNHHPDPSVVENLIKLGEKVLEVGADLGISYDGDEDRVGIVAETGEMVPMDSLMVVFVRDMINSVSNKTFLYDIKCSKALDDEIVKLGGTPYCYRSGASYTQAEVLAKGVPFGAEYSGHLYFADRSYPATSGIYSGLRLLEILSKCDLKMSELLEGINKYYSYPEEKIPTDDDIKDGIVEKIIEYGKAKNYKLNDIDGARFTFDDGWALIRVSNTGPNITTRFEATTKERLEIIRNEFRDEIQNALDKIK